MPLEITAQDPVTDRVPTWNGGVDRSLFPAPKRYDIETRIVLALPSGKTPPDLLVWRKVRRNGVESCMKSHNVILLPSFQVCAVRRRP